MESKEVFVKVERDDFVPSYATEFSAGADLKAAIDDEIVVMPGSTVLVPTGIIVEVPPGYELQIRPRSGLALKFGVTVLNTPGTVDADYRGEVGVVLINHGKDPFVVAPGMRIAQAVLSKIVKALFLKKEKLSETLRSRGGFGHTGSF